MSNSTGKYVDDLARLLRAGEAEPAGQEREWADWLKAAQSERVAPLVYETARHAQAACVPSDVMARLAAHHHRTLARNVLIQETLGDALARLAAAGIPALVLKGGALAELVYGNFGLRPMVDVDVLVKMRDAVPALAALKRAGYREAGQPELWPGFDLEFRAEAELLSAGAAPCMVEIHWRLIGPIFACRHVDEAAVWRRAVAAAIAGQPALVLGPEDWVLHQAAHAIYKHRRADLLDLCDMDRLIRYWGDRLSWERVLEIGRAFHWLPALANVLDAAARVLATPVPASVIEQARAFRLPWVEQLLMQWWLAPGRPEQQHVVPDWLTASSLGARWRMLRAYMMPSRSYMDRQYPQGAAWPWPRRYAHRLWAEAVKHSRVTGPGSLRHA